MYLQVNKEKSFHKSKHCPAHKHHDEEHHDVDVGQDGLHSLHGVTLGQTNVLVYKAEADERTEQKNVGDHEWGGVVNGSRHGSDLVHYQPNKGGHDGGGQGLVGHHYQPRQTGSRGQAARTTLDKWHVGKCTYVEY